MDSAKLAALPKNPQPVQYSIVTARDVVCVAMSFPPWPVPMWDAGWRPASTLAVHGLLTQESNNLASAHVSCDGKGFNVATRGLGWDIVAGLDRR